MSKFAFPDIIGPSSVAANGGAAVGIRGRVLNIVSPGVSATDDPARRRTNLQIPDATWTVTSVTTGSSGEWIPNSDPIAAADLVRVSSSTTGTILVALDSTDDPIKLVKFIANVGSNTINIAPPGSPSGDHKYVAGSFTLTAGTTARATWDVISRVYRLRTTAPATSSYIVVDGQRIVVDGNPILNPQ